MKKYIKSARRKSTETLQYKGCFIVKTPGGLDVYDSDTNLQKEGLTNMTEARSIIDNMVSGDAKNKASNERRYRSYQLPDGMDVFLEDIVQMFGCFTHEDIINHSYSESDLTALKELRERVNDLFEDYVDADYIDDGSMDRCVRQIAAIVKGIDVEACNVSCSSSPKMHNIGEVSFEDAFNFLKTVSEPVLSKMMHDYDAVNLDDLASVIDNDDLIKLGYRPEPMQASSSVTAGYYDPPEDHDWTELDPEKETIEIDIDARIIIDTDGSYEYEDTSYPWAKSPFAGGDWYADFYGVYLADPIDIVEHVDDLLLDKLPNEPGEYYISGHASLTFEITGVVVHRDGFWDDQGFDYDEGSNTDDAEATYLEDESSLADIQIEKI